MVKLKCDLCREEKFIDEFRITNKHLKNTNKICRKCESQRGTELWI